MKQFWAARFTPDNHLAIAQNILYRALGIQKLYVTVDIDVQEPDTTMESAAAIFEVLLTQ